MTLNIILSGIGDATSVTGAALSAPFAYKDNNFPGTGADCSSTISSNCSIIVTFSPPAASGSYSTSLILNYFNGDSFKNISILLQGFGAPALGANLVISDASTFDFGTLSIASSLDKTFTIQNTGVSSAASVDGAGLGGGSAFDWKSTGVYPGAGGTCGTDISLTPGGDCTIVVSYTPPANGIYTDIILINYDGTSQSTRPIKGDTPAIISISDGPTYDFGAQSVLSATDKTFIVTNSGGANAKSLSEVGLSAPFSMTGNYPGGGTCGASIAPSPGGDCTIVVRYNPTSAGNFSSIIQLDYNDGISSTNTTRNVIGSTTISNAELVISDGPTYDYGSVVIAAGGADKTFTVNNTGGVSATSLGGSGLIAPFNFKGSNVFPGTGGSCVNGGLINAGAACTIVVTYDPMAGGDHSDTIQVDYHNGVNTLASTRPIKGKTEATLSISDGATFNYGNVFVGVNVEKTFTATNNGFSTATALGGGSFTLADYTFVGGIFPGSGGSCINAGALDPGVSCTLVVNFNPVSATVRNDTLIINYNDGISPTNAIRDVTGIGLNPATLSISESDPFDYGSVIIFSTKDHTFTVTKGGDVDATGLGESGLGNPPYLMVGGYPGTNGTCTDPLTVTCTIVVRYAPLIASVADNDTIILDFNDGTGSKTATRDVTGNATGTNSAPVVEGFFPASPHNSSELLNSIFQITSSSDPDGDKFTIRWLVEGVEKQAPCSPDCTASTFTLSTTYQSSGSFIVRAELNDGTNITLKDWTLNISEVLDHNLLANFNPKSGTAPSWATAISMGDMNGDGIDDIAVGCPTCASNDGIVYLYNGATGAEIWNRIGTDRDGKFGTCVDIGNINGTMVVAGSAPKGPTTGSTKRRGRVQLYDSSGILYDEFVGQNENKEYGACVKIINDVDGDSINDVAISSMVEAKLLILKGDDLTSLIHEVSGISGQEWGSVLSLMPDIDGDGFQEILIGNPGYGGNDTGRVDIFTTGPNKTFLGYYEGQAANERLGESLAGLGSDVTGDGVADFIVGVPGVGSGAGEVQIVEGNTCSGCEWSMDRRFIGIGADAKGSCVAAADVNNDGSDDIIIGSRGANNGDGEIQVYSGKNSENYRPYYTMSGGFGEALGASCAGGGDFSSGGIKEDFIAGGSSGNGTLRAYKSSPD